jgi:hypothetical protein
MKPGRFTAGSHDIHRIYHMARLFFNNPKILILKSIEGVSMSGGHF